MVFVNCNSGFIFPVTVSRIPLPGSPKHFKQNSEKLSQRSCDATVRYFMYEAGVIRISIIVRPQDITISHGLKYAI